MKSPISCVLSVILLTGLSLIVQETQAIPSFARKYKTSCTTCHYAFPSELRVPFGDRLKLDYDDPGFESDLFFIIKKGKVISHRYKANY